MGGQGRCERRKFEGGGGGLGGVRVGGGVRVDVY